MYLFALTFAESYKEVFYSLKYINSNMSKAFIVLLTLFLAIFGRKKKGKKEFLIAYAQGFVRYLQDINMVLSY